MTGGREQFYDPTAETGSVFLEVVMKTFCLVIIVAISVAVKDFARAAELPVITVAMVDRKSVV